MLSSPTLARIRVAVDVRCLEVGALRGWTRYTLELIDHLRRRDTVDLVAWTDRALPFDLAIRVLRIGGPSELVREQFRLPLQLRRAGVDVLLCPANRGLPLVPVIPSVLTLHDAVEWDPVFNGDGRHNFRFRYASAASLAAATRVLTVSHASARAIADCLAVPPSRIRVVYEAADDRFFADSPAARVAEVRSRYGVDERAVLYVGGFDAKKDVQTLVRAFARLDRPTAPQLVLAGDHSSDDAHAVRQLVVKLGLGETVRFCGYVDDDDLPALYRSARVFAYPAVAEGFGLPVVEALASGVPSVVARAGSLPEVVGDAALLFAPGDEEDAARRLRELLEKESGRSALSARASERARSFSWARTAAETEAVLREAASVGAATRVMHTTAALRSLTRWAR